MWWHADDPTFAADLRGYVAGLVRAPGMVRAAGAPLRPWPPPGPDAGPDADADAPDKAPLPAFVATNPFAHPQTLGLFYGEKMRAIHTVSPDRGVSQVVEVGGGQSGLAAALYPRADVLTVDLDASFGSRSDLYGAVASDGAPHRRFVAGDAIRLPLADDVADVVTLFDVLEHIPDDVTAVREALRILRPGGRLLVSTPTDTWRFPFYRVYRGCTPTDRDVMDDWGHVRRGYTMAELDRLVGRTHDAMATFITPVTVVAHDLAFSRLPATVKRAVGLGSHPWCGPRPVCTGLAGRARRSPCAGGSIGAPDRATAAASTRAGPVARRSTAETRGPEPGAGPGSPPPCSVPGSCTRAGDAQLADLDDATLQRELLRHALLLMTPKARC